MHTLSRQIRFSIDPFAKEQVLGFNSYASKPYGAGLCLYLALWVDLASPLNPDTGFVVNVSEIDKVVRRQAIPIFSKAISDAYTSQRTLSLSDLVEILRKSWRHIQKEFQAEKVVQLRLELNPFRSLSLLAENDEMFTYSEKFEFAAMHRLWNDRFDAKQNEAFFGKCANPAGHGHNYILEVTIQRPCQNNADNGVVEMARTVEENFLNLVDHKNLNVDVEGFEKLNPTVENLAYFAWEKLAEKFKDDTLMKITVWENDRTYCSYTG